MGTNCSNGIIQSCDTIVVFQDSPSEGRHAIFAKNSDRPGLECQPLASLPASEHHAGATVSCEYLTIPQVRRTLAVLGSRPHWLWGFEHGVNESGVAIGNEAIYTRDPVADTGLQGMDLVRLGLERGSTAAKAKQVITSLLEEFGQGGSSVHGKDTRYHNSFIIADANEAWVIETSGKHWVGRRTTEGAVISNLVTIEDDWDEASPGLVDHARQAGYWSKPSSVKINFRSAFEDASARKWTEARYRVGCALLASTCTYDVPVLMRYLRDHFEAGTVNGTDARGAQVERTVCVHPSDARGSTGSTSASIVVKLTNADEPPTAWTSMATPCTGVFIPVRVGQQLLDRLTLGSQEPDDRSQWWGMRGLQWVTDKHPALLTPLVQATWGEFERELLIGGALSDLQLAQLVDIVADRRDRLILDLTQTQLARDPSVETEWSLAD